MVSLEDVRSRLEAVRDGLQARRWPIPVLGIVLGLALGVGLPRLDAGIDQGLSSATTAYLFGGGPSAARTLLGAIAGSLITVTSLTFSLTVLTLQLASSQFSPRLLRTFTRDRFVHFTLGLFVATFTYALAVLRTVRDVTSTQTVFVPQLSVTVAFVLAIASVVGLVLFLAHLAREIRVETMLRKVHGDASDTIRRILSEHEPGSDSVVGPDPPIDAVPMSATASGFLLALDEHALLAAAVEADAVLLVDRFLGDSLVAGTPIGVRWSPTGPMDSDIVTRLGEQVAAAISTGFERTAVHDVRYGLRQLTDVATKALSPGINDPTTAVHALGHCSALLCELAGRDLGPRILRGEHDQIRVVMSRPDLADLLDLAITQPRRYGAADPFVLGRLFDLLRELAWCVQTQDQQHAVTEQLARLRATAAAQDFAAAETARLARLATRVEQAQHGHWTPEPGNPGADQ